MNNKPFRTINTVVPLEMIQRKEEIKKTWDEIIERGIESYEKEINSNK